MSPGVGDVMDTAALACWICAKNCRFGLDLRPQPPKLAPRQGTSHESVTIRQPP
jgi:hypothetical protein